MIVLSRIDSRLIHGQVIEAWLPHLGVKRVVVADDDAALDPLAKVAYSMAIPDDVELVLASVKDIDFQEFADDGVPTLVLFREVKSAVAAREWGLPDGMLNVGNVHSGPGRVSVSRSVYLDSSDSSALARLAQSGMTVRVQAVPSEAAQSLP
ncbi:MAG: PTS sugar transporter subunit IIB [Archangium sp.]|nr:PTS sugar transporter subunit IIB [Archangium sp.]MDP3156814.1 PTS sugar transporter subunit IIB [Archangium sp.]MDP3569662.1 PTS sugar transporter subunit IIB [Archangium sp.]